MNEHNFNEEIVKELPNRFGGSERKKTVVIGNDIYLLKLPDPVREQGRSLSYINNSISEYLGCHILQSLGIKTQETMLGTYYDKDKNKTYIACACKNIAVDGYTLGEIANISLSDSYGDYAEKTTLSSVHMIAEKLSKTAEMPKTEILKYYYDLLVADFLIGNTDRHNRNWGILTHPTKPTCLAPVFDCGSSLSPLLSDEDLRSVNINNIAKDETSVLHGEDNQRYKWLAVLSLTDPLIVESLKRIVPRININVINQIINDTPYISDIRKSFYKELIQIRYEQVLLPLLDKEWNKNVKNADLENPYDTYVKLGLNQLKVGDKHLITSVSKDVEYYIFKVSNRYAFLYDEDEVAGIIPVRSNNDEIRKAFGIIENVEKGIEAKQEEQIADEVGGDYDDVR